MSRTKRETSVDVNVVLLMNKGCFLYLCLSFLLATSWVSDILHVH